MRGRARLALRVAAFLLLAAAGGAEEELEIGRFSAAPPGGLPEGWEPLPFEKVPEPTRYRGVEEEGRRFVRAESAAAASGLIRRVEVDLREYPVLRWSWRVANVLERGDVTKKAGDDYPARIYVTFAYEPERVGLWKRAKYRAARAVSGGDLPIAAINYLWASRASQGAIVDNAYAPGFVKMIVVESGPEHAGEWRHERRNVLEDYREAFGDDPPPVNGVAIMTDTDDTGESATADYGDIVFVRP